MAVSILARLLLSGVVVAQTRVSGTTLDASTGEPVEGVSVVLVGTLFGTATGPDGRFSLGPVPDGRYTIRAIRSGFQPIDIPIVAPAQDMILRLGKARVQLARNPLATVAQGFLLGSFSARGDPLLGNTDSAMRRIPGVQTLRYGSGLSTTTVRGLTEGRTAQVSGPFPSFVLDVPGVGRIDPGAAAVEGTVYFGRSPATDPFMAAAIWDSPDPFAEPVFASTVIEAGYQTNLAAFQGAGLFRGRAAGTRYRLYAAHDDGSGYKDASSREVPASYTRSSGSLALEKEIGASSRLNISGLLSDVRSTEIPGTLMYLHRGSVRGVSAGGQYSPESTVLRRLAGTIALARSRADFNSLSGADSGDAEKSMLSATIMADLYYPGLDWLLIGAHVERDRFRGSVLEGDTLPMSVAFWPDVRAVTSALTISAGRSGLSTDVAVVGGVGLSRYTSAAADAPATPADVHTVNDVLGSMSVSLSHRRGRSLQLFARLAAVRRSPSVLQRYSATASPVDGARSVEITGNPYLSPEQLFLAEWGARKRIGSAAIIVRPFYSHIRHYVAARPPDVVGGPEGTWTFANGSAHYWGFEVGASYVPMPFVSVSGHVDFTRGTERRTGGPPAMVPPLSGRVDFTAASPDGRILLELSSEFVFFQNRVASRLGELPGHGYALVHWWIGLPVSDRVSLRIGVYNLLDKQFDPNPGLFNAEGLKRIAGPGRSWLFAVRISG